jgi:hypothetical protein
MPTSAAARRARCRRSARPSTRKACCSTTSCWCATARLREPNCARSWQSGRYPARNPDQTIADLRAQIAANEKGVQELRAMVAQFGRDTVAPTCAMCRTTPRNRCAASSRR